MNSVILVCKNLSHHLQQALQKLVSGMTSGKWDEQFLVLEPGETVTE